MRGYYFITDSRLSRRGNFSDVKNALKAGVKIVQYRQKDKCGREMYEEALRLRRLCRDITFLVNDRVDIAMAVGADGVHLGQDDLPLKDARRLLGKGKVIGITVHSLKEALLAERGGADYVAVSPIFPTKTKPDIKKPAGTGLLRKISRRVRIPVAAIGGINLANAEEVLSGGADCLCAISAVVAKEDVFKEINRFRSLFDKVKEGSEKK